MATWTCEQCGKVFDRPPSGVGKHPFCSVECSRAWQKANNPKGADHCQYSRVVLTCDWCGKTFRAQRHKATDGRKHYCSTKCMHKALGALQAGRGRHTNEVIDGRCAQCGKSIHRKRIELESKPRFCSLECRGAWYSHNYSGANSPQWRGQNVAKHYGRKWAAISRRIRQRDGNHCIACGSTANLQVHHIIPLYECDADHPHDETNLVTLCASCHSKVTQNDEIIPRGKQWDRVRDYMGCMQRAPLFSIGARQA